ncbi:retroviral-like aspartic protease family protein [Sphingopyxis sp.]|uniref:retroviral-like aspartic protease family protein n=1 Tax=Sphingopyxis sp. TaxID=1908224 RepID=UPI0026346F1C|nr:retroviral-like aspartic protease family protein [Sphingopyxis sp.]MCW0196916.1 retroviral-like aspartic protease family protein [Sphingopyxis sp.]
MIDAIKPSAALLLAAPLLIGAAQPPAGSPPAASQAPAMPSTPVPPATGETLAPPVLVTPFIQPFDLDATRRMAVKVMVGGEGPFSFLVDTGAERTVIARELAERLGLAEGAKLKMATIGGSAVVPSYRVAAVEMANLRLAAIDAPALLGRHLGAAGLVGVDMLEGRRVLIDFRKESMEILETRKRARPIIHDDDAIVVTARNAAGRLILSDARIDGKRIDVIVDTGAQTSVGNLALQRLVVRRRANLLPFTPATLSAVTGEDVSAQRTAIKRITLNGLDVNNLPISFADSQAFRALGLQERPALLLGMDGLALFDRVEIDFPNRRVVFDLPSGASRETGQRFAANGEPRIG